MQPSTTSAIILKYNVCMCCTDASALHHVLSFAADALQAPAMIGSTLGKSTTKSCGKHLMSLAVSSSASLVCLSLQGLCLLC